MQRTSRILFLLVLFTVAVTVNSDAFSNRRQIEGPSSGDETEAIGNYSKPRNSVRTGRPLDMDRRGEAEHAFYTTVSCKFSQWTIHQVYGLLKLVPLFDRNNGRSIDDGALVAPYKESISTFKTVVDKYVDRFVRILNDILDTNSDVLYYSDTTILKTLVSLQVHTHYAPLQNERSDDDAHVLPAIRSILSDMTALQRFRLMNCSETPSDSDNSHLSGYWIRFDGAAVDIEEFLSGMEKTKSEPSAPLACSVTQTLLENFVTLSTNDEISLDILNAEVMDTKTNKISVREILKRIEKEHDVEMISSYQNSVLTTIIKIISSNIMRFLQEPIVYSAEISECTVLINQINTTISKITYLPLCLVNGFTILNAALKISQTDIKESYTSLSSTGLGEIELSVTNVKNEMIYLRKMFHVLSHNINDLQCVRQYFKCLYDEHKRYHVPFIEDENNFRPIVLADKMHSSENLCNFIISIYWMCLQCFLPSNSCTNNEKSTDKTNNCQKVWELINTVKTYFLLIIKNETDDLGFLQMSYNIAMVLVNIRQPSKNSNNFFGLQKSLEVIMSHLYSIELKYCTSENSNLLLFYNIKFMKFDLIQQSIHSFFEKNLRCYEPSHILSLDVQPSYNNFISVAYLYNRSIELSDFFKKYENNIRIYWEGTLKTVKNIFKEFLDFSLNPKNVYALYDIYFKFNITAVYYEIINILDTYEKDQNFINVVFKKVPLILTYFEYNNFPKELKQFILNIKTLYDIQLPVKGASSIIDRRNINRQIIDEQLGAFNIVITKNSSNMVTKIQTVFKYFSPERKVIESLQMINEQFQNQVHYVLFYFSLIEKYRNYDNR